MKAKLRANWGPGLPEGKIVNLIPLNKTNSEGDPLFHVEGDFHQGREWCLFHLDVIDEEAPQAKSPALPPECWTQRDNARIDFSRITSEVIGRSKK